MELMEGLTVVATESNGDVGAYFGVIIIGLVLVAFGGLLIFLSDGYEGIGIMLGALWTLLGVFLIVLAISFLLFSEPTEIYTVIADNSVSLNQILEQYEILECDGNMLKIQLRD
jgi:hypothetical protein